MTGLFDGCVDPVTDSVPDVRRNRLSGQLDLRKDGRVLPLLDTRVTFPAGGLTTESEVLAVTALDDCGRPGEVGIVTDVSPFHPVDDAWPDQDPDRGVLLVLDAEVEIIDVVLGATQGANLLSSTNIPVRRGAPGWAFLVVHVVAAHGPLPTVGERVELRVDASHRAALSLGHTACHLAALALNAALADRWRKPVALDGLGRPNFDGAALLASRIAPHRSHDTYRIGKSLRKRGFEATGLDLAHVAASANAVLAGWVAAGVRITVDAQGPGLTDRRTWVCELPEGTERIPCGGTHPVSLAGVAAIDIGLRLSDAELIMETNVTVW